MRIILTTLLTGVLIVGSGGLRGQDPPIEEGNSPELHGDPFTPVGTLAVNPVVVQPGVQPMMEWGIEYPKTVSDLSIVIPPGKLILTETTDVRVRLAGIGDQCEDQNRSTALWIRVGGSGAVWQLIFYGKAEDVQPDVWVYEQKNVPVGTEIDFAARGKSSSDYWYGTRWTLEDGPTLVGLVNGDDVPDYSLAFDQGRVESFMTQYLDGSNQVVVGPRDIIYLFELAETDPNVQCFDQQDVVPICTLGKQNNGHGNNLDGVDVSNPGNSKEGEDTDPTIDDEGKIYRGKKDKD